MTASEGLDLEAPAPTQEPLLYSGAGGDCDDIGDDKLLGGEFRRLETFLAILGFCHSDSSRLRLAASCSVFLILGVAAPFAGIYLPGFSRFGLVEYEIESFELTVLASQASLAAVSLICVSWNLFKYGVRRFLFVDRHDGQVEKFQKEYARKIQEFFCLLIWWIFPCFLVKIALEIIRVLYIFREPKWKLVVIFSVSIISWAYLTTILLSACCLFSLLCSLQSIHFEDYGKLLEEDADPLMCLEEHVHLRHNLSKISHRFRIFLILLFMFVTASQFVTLFQTTEYNGIISFRKAGDLALSSVVQVVGVVFCLHAASRISHKAQGIASLASRWHAILSCSATNSTPLEHSNSSADLEAMSACLLATESSESDSESLEYVRIQSNIQLASSLSSYPKRQALVMYLQSNPGGITIFGWTVDRALINTLFCIELTIMLFVLSVTVVSSQ